MKFLLVLALALVAVSAEEEAAKPAAVLPLAYNAWNNWAYNYPTVYNNLAYTSATPYYHNNFYHGLPYAYPQVQIKPVEKEVEYTVKKIEFVAPEGACKNIFGAPVPCHKAKRSTEEEEMKPEEEKKIIPFTYGYGLPYAYNYPTVYNQYYNQYPLAYNYPAYTTASVAYTAPTVAYSSPVTTYASPLVYHTRVARSAEEEEMKPEEEKKIVPFTYGYGLPYAYNYPTVYNQYYNQYPLAYNYPAYTAAPLAYTVPKPIVKEVEYIKPVVKTVVQKVPLVPACKNAWGFNVPCAHNE